jgi:predicted RNase H-like HicB family nuclease
MAMQELMLKLRIESLEEGGFVATSPDLPGLVAQGKTRAETVEIAQDVAREIIELHIEKNIPLSPAIRAALKSSKRVSQISIPVDIAMQEA